MKTRSNALVILATALGFAIAGPLSAAPKQKPAYSHSVGSVERYGNTLVARGYAMHNVERSLGAPHLKLSADVWAYYQINAGYAQSADDDCTTLLITFVQGRVTDLKLINDRAKKIYVAQLRTKATDKTQVAAK